MEQIAAMKAEAECTAAEKAEVEHVAADKAKVKHIAAEKAEVEHIAAKKAEALAKKCTNVNFTAHGLQEPECELRTLMERLVLPEVLQLALAGTGNRSLQTVAMHYCPGAGMDK